MNRVRDLLHSARFLLIVLPVVGVSLAVAVGCSQVTDGEGSEDSNAAISHKNSSGYGGYGYGGSSGYSSSGDNGSYGYGNYGDNGSYGDDDDDCGWYGYGYGCHH